MKTSNKLLLSLLALILVVITASMIYIKVKVMDHIKSSSSSPTSAVFQPMEATDSEAKEEETSAMSSKNLLKLPLYMLIKARGMSSYQ